MYTRKLVTAFSQSIWIDWVSKTPSILHLSLLLPNPFVLDNGNYSFTYSNVMLKLWSLRARGITYSFIYLLNQIIYIYFLILDTVKIKAKLDRMAFLAYVATLDNIAMQLLCIISLCTLSCLEPLCHVMCFNLVNEIVRLRWNSWPNRGRNLYKVQNIYSEWHENSSATGCPNLNVPCMRVRWLNINGLLSLWY